MKWAEAYCGSCLGFSLALLSSNQYSGLTNVESSLPGPYQPNLEEMMNERIVNIFVYVDRDAIRSIGYTEYEMEGTYEELTGYLQSRVEVDHAAANRIELAEEYSPAVFRYAMRMEALQYLIPLMGEIVGDSVYCVTQIVDGALGAHEPMHDHEHNQVPDYLRIYGTKRGFDFGQLMDDDFMDAIKLLWDHQKYIAALKLMFIMIDTLGFVAFGPLRDAFTRWLDKYCELNSLGVSSVELWELRNSVLHMSNLASNRVERGAVTRLSPVFTSLQYDIPVEMDGFKNLHSARLIGDVVPRGVLKWVQSMSADPEKFMTFVERYDTVVSEARTSVAYFPDFEDCQSNERSSPK